MRMGCKVIYEMICVMKPFPSFSSFNPHHIVLFCDKTVTFSLKAISSLNVSRKRLDYYLHKVKAGDIEALSKKSFFVCSNVAMINHVVMSAIIMSM